MNRKQYIMNAKNIVWNRDTKQDVQTIHELLNIHL
jgi:hypothetical protein